MGTKLGRAVLDGWSSNPVGSLIARRVQPKRAVVRRSTHPGNTRDTAVPMRAHAHTRVVRSTTRSVRRRADLGTAVRAGIARNELRAPVIVAGHLARKPVCGSSPLRCSLRWQSNRRLPTSPSRRDPPRRCPPRRRSPSTPLEHVLARYWRDARDVEARPSRRNHRQLESPAESGYS